MDPFVLGISHTCTGDLAPGNEGFEKSRGHLNSSSDIQPWLLLVQHGRLSTMLRHSWLAHSNMQYCHLLSGHSRWLPTFQLAFTPMLQTAHTHTHTLSHIPTLQWYFQFFLQWLPMLSHYPVYLLLGGCLMELLTEMLLCAAEVWSSKREWVWVLSLATWEVLVSLVELFMCLVSKQMLQVSSVLLRQCVCFLKNFVSWKITAF